MRALAAVIAYNEQENIAAVIDDLRRNAPACDVVVIDNGSTDRTVEICRSLGVPCVAHAVNTGSPYGTVMAYMLYAHEKGYDIVCQFDGDGQHMARCLADLMQPIIGQSADLVIGSRFIDRAGFQSSLPRRIGIAYLSGLMSLAIGRGLSDVTSGFKAYGRPVIDFFANRYRKEIHDGIQMLLMAAHQRFRIVEVAVQMRPRLHGISEFASPYRSLVFPLKATLSVLAYLAQVKRIAPQP